NGELPSFFDAEIVRNVYGYNFELKQIDKASAIPEFNGSSVLVSQKEEIGTVNLAPNVDFFINLYENLGSILIVNGEENESYISEIQHVRRRETIAMTPANCLIALKSLAAQSAIERNKNNATADKASVLDSIKTI